MSVNIELGHLVNKIEGWAEERNLIVGATCKDQMLKMTEEVGELAAGIARKDEKLTKDAIGDCVVVLTILAAQLGTDLTICVNHAWNEIKDRKGVMRDGIFIKEE